MRTLLILALASVSALASSPLIRTNINPTIDGWYHYEYTFTTDSLTSVRVSTPDVTSIVGLYATGGYNPATEYSSGPDWFQINDITTEAGKFIFWFDSKRAPEIGTMEFTIGGSTFQGSVLSPVGAIPEPSSAFLLLVAAPALFRRKRHLP